MLDDARASYGTSRGRSSCPSGTKPRSLAAMPKGFTVLCLVVASCLADPARAATGDELVWRTDRGQVDAHVDAWPLTRVLERISSATGWDVYVEPDTQYAVTARFEDLKPRDALRRLLGDLNFALLPQTTGPAKLFVYRHSVEDATQILQVAKKPASPRRERIPNELIVTLRPGATGDLDALAKRLHGRVVGRLDGQRAGRLAFDDAAEARRARGTLEHDGDVGSVEDNFVLGAPGMLEPLAMSSAPAFPLPPNISPSADGVVVGLIDTAVQAQGSVFKDFLQAGISVAGDYQPPADPITHGTAMAETILDGVARALAEGGDPRGQAGISILPIDVYGGNETTNTFDLARGLHEALGHHANVINLSLAGDNESPLVQSLIEEAERRGVLFFAAAGNAPVSTPTYPAADPGVIAVTAGDGHGNVAPYANRGSFVDAMAPGVNVVHYQDAAWLGTGTSFATSWVSGWAAGYMSAVGNSSSATQSATLKRWAFGAQP